MKPKNLYIVTGKGGVGKTSIALALTLALKQKKTKVLYHCFDQASFSKLITALEVPLLDLDLEESMKIYVGRKLHSEIIASFVLKAPFFKSMLAMVPGLGQLILLGHIIDILEKDPDLTIIVDSPSSGHTMTMMESMENFKKIFNSGLLVEDINRMEKFFFLEKRAEILISSLPTYMALNECIELKKFFKEKGPIDVQILVNEYLGKNALINREAHQLPVFLKKKLEIENEVMEKFNSEINYFFPFVISHSPEEVITSLIPQLSEV